VHHFTFKRGELHCEDVRVSDVARKVGTPFYLYSEKTLLHHFCSLADAFREVDPLICFSMKCNSNLAVLKLLYRAGAGFDIVSGGELYKALKIKADPSRIVYASVGKSAKEIETAVKKGILLFNVESIPELLAINSISADMRRRARVAIRVNPDIAPKTHKHIVTGAKETKFGIDLKTAEGIFDNSNKYPHLDIEGIHVHIGSQITESAPYVRALKRISKFIKDSRIDIEILNIGGGLGIVYDDESPQTAEQFAKAILPIIKPLKKKIILEPGRFIAGNAGILVTSVVYSKVTPYRKFVIVDAGFNDLIRPSFYDAFHGIVPVKKVRGAKSEIVDVVGPVCESGDFFAKSRRMREMRNGEFLAIMGAGAYGFTMASNYNARVRPCEVLVSGSDFYVVKERETYKDLVKGESIPLFLR